jgi:hypothetical protein
MVSGSKFRQEGTTSLPSRPRGSGRERGRGVDGSESSRGLAPTLRSQQGARTQSAVKDLGESRSEAGSHPSDRGIEMHGGLGAEEPGVAMGEHSAVGDPGRRGRGLSNRQEHLCAT